MIRRELKEEEGRALVRKYRHLLFTPNVVSVSYGDRKNYQKTRRRVLGVGVIEKLPTKSIRYPNVLLPKFVTFPDKTGEIVEVPVVVMQEGRIRPLGAPYNGGSRIRNEGYTGVGRLGVGSLGVGTDYHRQYRLLSAAHVLTGFQEENLVKYIEVYDPDEEKWETLAPITGHIPVEVYGNIPKTIPEEHWARQDLAWADVTEQHVSRQEVERIGQVQPIREEPIHAEMIKIFGGKSKRLEESIYIDCTYAALRLELPIVDHQGVITYKYVFFEDVCRVKRGHKRLIPGDSGSAVIAERDNAIIGILFGASEPKDSYYFCKLN